MGDKGSQPFREVKKIPHWMQSSFSTVHGLNTTAYSIMMCQISAINKDEEIEKQDSRGLEDN